MGIEFKQTHIKQIKISVIIPSYKPGKYIYKCIDTLEEQDNNSLYEIIIVLNGCKEPYLSQLKSYTIEHSYNNIRIIQSDIAGVSFARNIGIDQAKGKYVLFIDDDDWVSPKYLDHMYALACDNNTIVHSNIIQIEENTNKILPHFINASFKKNKNKTKNTLFCCRSMLSSCWAKLIPKHIIGIQRFNINHKLGEDSLFMFCISHNIKNVVLTSSNDIYYVRARKASASRKHYSYYQRIKVAFRLVKSYTWQYLHHPFSYNVPFFLSRVIATIIKLRKKQYE